MSYTAAVLRSGVWAPARRATAGHTRLPLSPAPRARLCAVSGRRSRGPDARGPPPRPGACTCACPRDRGRRGRDAAAARARLRVLGPALPRTPPRPQALVASTNSRDRGLRGGNGAGEEEGARPRRAGFGARTRAHASGPGRPPPGHQRLLSQPFPGLIGKETSG